MIQAIKGILSSKKFWMTVIGSAVCAALTYVQAPNELIAVVGALFGTNVVGQGLADFGKNKNVQP